VHFLWHFSWSWATTYFTHDFYMTCIAKFFYSQGWLFSDRIIHKFGRNPKCDHDRIKKKNWKRIENKFQIEKGNKSPNRKGRKESKYKLEKVNWLKKKKSFLRPRCKTAVKKYVVDEFFKYACFIWLILILYLGCTKWLIF
jgi:hypothetical protein